MINRVDWKNFNRILLIGSPGTGKSTTAKFLGEKLNLEVIHLDKYFWKPDWEMRSRYEFDEIVLELIMKDKWIMDGNYSRTLKARAKRADLIIFFDFPSYFCVFRILKRSFKTKLGFEKRTDMADGCDEKWIDREFVNFVWNFKKRTVPGNYLTLNEIGFEKNKIIVLRNRSESEKFFKCLNF